MINKHFCQGPHCHTKATTDRFLKSKGIIRGRYARLNRDHNTEYYPEDKYFCSLTCSKEWLGHHMSSIERGIPVSFIRERRFTEGYEKKINQSRYGYTFTNIQRIEGGATE